MAENFLVPKTQKASKFDKVNGPIEVREVPVAEPGPDELLVKILYSGVCHSDLHLYNGELPIPGIDPSFVAGHEGVGIVVKKGDNVNNFELGDYAGIRWAAMCLSCDFCKSGHESSCSTIPPGFRPGSGTFQQFAITKAIEAAKLPKEIELAKAAPLLCAGLTIYRALKESHVRPGEWLALTGAGGGLGSFGVQYAKAMGMRVVAIDIPAKEQHCKKLGAEIFIDARSETLVQDIVKATDGGVHGVVNVATAEKAIEDSVLYVRPRGTVVLVSLPKGALIKSPVLLVVMKCITIKGSMIGNRKDQDEAIDFLARNKIDVPVEVHPLSALPQIYERMEKGQINGRAVLDLWA